MNDWVNTDHWCVSFGGWFTFSSTLPCQARDLHFSDSSMEAVAVIRLHFLLQKSLCFILTMALLLISASWTSTRECHQRLMVSFFGFDLRKMWRKLNPARQELARLVVCLISRSCTNHSWTFPLQSSQANQMQTVFFYLTTNDLRWMLSCFQS